MYGNVFPPIRKNTSSRFLFRHIVSEDVGNIQSVRLQGQDGKAFCFRKRGKGENHGKDVGC